MSEIDAESDCFTIVVAHEFFDALPVHVFEVRLVLQLVIDTRCSRRVDRASFRTRADIASDDMKAGARS